MKPSWRWFSKVQSIQACGLADQSFIPQEVGQRHQAIQVVGTAFPTLPVAAQPAAVGPEVRPELIDVSRSARPPGSATGCGANRSVRSNRAECGASALGNSGARLKFGLARRWGHVARCADNQHRADNGCHGEDPVADRLESNQGLPPACGKGTSAAPDEDEVDFRRCKLVHRLRRQLKM